MKIDILMSKNVISTGVIITYCSDSLEIIIDFFFISLYFIIPYILLSKWYVLGINFEVDIFNKVIRARFFNKFWEYEIEDV